MKQFYIKACYSDHPLSGSVRCRCHLFSIAGYIQNKVDPVSCLHFTCSMTVQLSGCQTSQTVTYINLLTYRFNWQL